MRGKNKRGLSTVIATLLIILLVIVSVGVIWAVIGNIIETSSGSISFDEFTINLEILAANQVDSIVNVKVRRNVGIGNLEGIIFSIFNGTDRFRYEKKNVSMDEFDVKTFVLDYGGKIVSISIYPIIKTDAGKIIVGDLADVYYFTSKDILGGDGEDEGGSGGEDEEPQCIPDCEDVICGESLNDCGTCEDTCEEGTYCNEGMCSPICSDEDCGTRVCGPLPDRPECLETNICGTCGEGLFCNDGTCEDTCIPSPDPSVEGVCGISNCGTAQNGTCGEISCGECDEGIGEWCEDGICTDEIALNTGTVYSIWPVNVGIYFDSPDLPTEEDIDYTNYWVRFPNNPLETDCLQIETYVTPILPLYYDMSYIKLISSYNTFVVGDDYEIWRSYGGCSTH